MTIATEILNQLGGSRFVAMTGAKHLAVTGTGNGLAFQLPRRFAKSGINAVRIELLPSDTYQVKFIKFTSTSIKTVAEYDGIYCDQLVDLFERETGLFTHL